MSRTELRLVPDDGVASDAVAVVGAGQVQTCADSLRPLTARAGGVVLVCDVLDTAGVVRAVDAGVRVIARRDDVDGVELVRLVVAARSGHGVLPPDLLGRLLGRSRPAPRRPSVTRRERDVLRLLADGLSTGEIAQELAYSERTIKGIVHGVTERFALRNRSHAVAFAVREGVI